MKTVASFLYLLILGFGACKSNGKGILDKKITKNEDKGIKEIIGSYGGLCEYGFQSHFNSGKPTENDFWLKFSKSRTIDSLNEHLPNFAALSCSNIIYLFYKNLGSENKSYTFIQGELILDNGEDLKRRYSLADLKIVQNRLETVEEIVGLIKSKKFAEIEQRLNPDTTAYDYIKKDFIKKIQQFENQLTTPVDFLMYGFTFLTTDSGLRILRISGTINRTGRASQFSVDFDPTSGSNKIYYLNYQL